ncbi:MAG: hypothetical protein M3O50_18580 [Myxococcota bacterium]|nr:hypothetical protein [Myxococcota bacterium]
MSTRSSRSKGGRFTMMELAIAFALGGSLLAVTLPAFVREIHASRFVEPVDGLKRLGSSAIAYARTRPIAQAFPAPAPLTPGMPPRGHCEADAPNAWDHPTWRALEFLPVSPGVPHCFAFAFDSSTSPARSLFRAHAHADLDGDGLLSTFEVTGEYVDGDARGAVLDPGMFIDSEVE